MQRETVQASAVVVSGTVETFRIVSAGGTGLLDRPRGVCEFDLSSVPPEQIDRSIPGRLRIVDSQGDGQYYVDVAVSSSQVVLGNIGRGCAVGVRPAQVTLVKASDKCIVSW